MTSMEKYRFLPEYKRSRSIFKRAILFHLGPETCMIQILSNVKTYFLCAHLAFYRDWKAQRWIQKADKITLFGDVYFNSWYSVSNKEPTIGREVCQCCGKHFLLGQNGLKFLLFLFLSSRLHHIFSGFF